MKIEKRTLEVFVSDNGKEFITERECQDYEKGLEILSRVKLYNDSMQSLSFGHSFLWDDEEAQWFVNLDDVYYIYCPDENTVIYFSEVCLASGYNDPYGNHLSGVCALSFDAQNDEWDNLQNVIDKLKEQISLYGHIYRKMKD